MTLFIDRPETDKFLSKLTQGLTDPVNHPLILHSWGTGGVGKTTLLAKIAERHPEAAIATVSFGSTSDIETPIELMKKLHEQLYPAKLNDGWEDNEDEFTSCYNKREIAISKLNKDKDAKEFSKILQGGIQVFSPVNKPVTDVVGSAIKTVSESTGLTDRFNDFLNRMPATRGNVELQKLINEPISILTKAFASSLRARSAQKAVLLIFDTYEKVTKDIDYWLYHWLLTNNELHDRVIRLVVTGRNNILRQEGWRKLQQDRNQQDRKFIDSQGVERFDKDRTKAYLAEIGIDRQDDFERFYTITKGLPYYLNLIREKLADGQRIDSNLTRMAQNIEDLFLQEEDFEKKRLMSQVSRVAACCQSFDRGLIQRLLAGLELPLKIDNRDCYTWLTEQHFFEEEQDRLDDVARDVFRQSLWREDREVFIRVHSLLADYYKWKSDRCASPESSYVDKYENEDWLTARSTYLYHRMFADRVDTVELIGYLLESRYFRENKLLQVPLQKTISEADIESHPFLSAQGRKFLIKIKPAIMKPWAILEESPIDYDYNKRIWNLSKSEIDEAVGVCLNTPAQPSRLAEFMRLYCKSRRCPVSSRIDLLKQAQRQVEQFTIDSESANFICDLLWAKVANSLYEIEAYEEAIAAYERAIEIKPDSHEAFNNKGSALDKLGRYEEAIAAYERAIEIKPDKHEAFYNKGNTLGNLGRYEEAIAAYERAIEIKPDSHEAFYNKGSALDDLGRYEEAIAAYERAIEIKPDKDEAWNGRGIALRRSGKVEEAIASYDRALEINPNDPDIWDNRGYALFFAGRYPEAMISYDRALEINPQHANALYNKSCVLAVSGEIDLAIASLEIAISIEPGNRELAETDPDFDVIRDDERFQQLIAQPNTQP